MTLGEYLQVVNRKPWVWGAADCCTFGAGWVVQCGHADPMDFLRPLYDTERSAMLTIQRGGGLVALWTHGMALSGVPEVDDRSAGVVAVLDTPTEDGLGQAIGIFTGERWATRAISGMHFGPAEPLRMWRP